MWTRGEENFRLIVFMLSVTVQHSRMPSAQPKGEFNEIFLFRVRNRFGASIAFQNAEKVGWLADDLLCLPSSSGSFTEPAGRMIGAQRSQGNCGPHVRCVRSREIVLLLHGYLPTLS